MKWSAGAGAATRLLIVVGVAIVIFVTLTVVWWERLPPALVAWEIFWAVVRRTLECLLGRGIGC